ncbi:MAG: hypothetical protein MJA29_08990 [Candidatus Omnitrophica bacterium]|nr:hypothetical protein [Candidatus Omnitrophota bacterium]
MSPHPKYSSSEEHEHASELEEKLREPFTETTRKQKKALLLLSTIGIIIVKAQIFPTEITALGVKFSMNDSKSLLWIFTGVLVYQILSFTICVISESVALGSLLQRKKLEIYQIWNMLNLTLRVRIFYDLLIPYIIAFAALSITVTAELPVNEFQNRSTSESTTKSINQTAK